LGDETRRAESNWRTVSTVGEFLSGLERDRRTMAMVSEFLSGLERDRRTASMVPESLSIVAAQPVRFARGMPRVPSALGSKAVHAEVSTAS
jgi:hypothetical protein